MKIYNTFPENHNTAKITVIGNIIKIFRTNLFAIILVKRELNDNHILMKFAYCNDGYWNDFIHTASAMYIFDFIDLFKEVNKWLVENAENTERGWYLKEDKLTCPFCESDDINVDFTTRYPNNKLLFYAQVECRNCGACGPKFLTACDNPKLAKEKAIEEWNSICKI
jgi:hypothetical protein